MRILVTGSQGQLGRCIQDVARNNPKEEFVFTDYEELDITHTEKVTDFFAKGNFDYCINCAAYTAVDKAENEPDLAFRINAEGPKNLAKVSKKHDCTLIHISTDFVFDGTKTSPYTEQDLPNPKNVYGASKLKGEKYIENLLDNYFIIRTSWVYSEYGHNFVKTMLRLGREKDEIHVVNDQVGCPTYAGDIADFIFFLIVNRRHEYGLYHFSNKGRISWYDFSKEIFKQDGSRVKVIPVPSEGFKSQAKRPNNSNLDLKKTVRTFHTKIPEWTESLKKCLQNITK